MSDDNSDLADFMFRFKGGKRIAELEAEVLRLNVELRAAKDTRATIFLLKNKYLEERDEALAHVALLRQGLNGLVVTVDAAADMGRISDSGLAELGPAVAQARDVLAATSDERSESTEPKP